MKKLIVLMILAVGVLCYTKFVLSKSETQNFNANAKLEKVEASEAAQASPPTPGSIPLPQAIEIAPMALESHLSLENEYHRLTDSQARGAIKKIEQAMSGEGLIEKANAQTLNQLEANRLGNLIRRKAVLHKMLIERIMSSL